MSNTIIRRLTIDCALVILATVGSYDQAAEIKVANFDAQAFQFLRTSVIITPTANKTRPVNQHHEPQPFHP